MKHSWRMRQNLGFKYPMHYRRKILSRLSLEQQPSVYTADFKTVSQVSLMKSLGLFSQRRLCLNQIYPLSLSFRKNENQRPYSPGVVYPPRVHLSAKMDETHRRTRVSHRPGVRCQFFSADSLSA